MKTFLLSSLLFMAMSCDAPQRTRYVTGPNTGNVTDGVDSVFSDDSSSDSEQSDNSSDFYTPTRAGFENCNVGHRYEGGSIGAFGICQSTQDEKVFAASFSQPDLSVGTCFVPMNLQNGVSHNVGRAECVRNQAETIYYPVLYKNQDKPINAVMVIKYSSLTPFMQCLNAKADYINGHPGCLYDQACVNQAQQYASTVCSSFVQHHSQNYKQISF